MFTYRDILLNNALLEVAMGLLFYPAKQTWRL